MPNYSYGIKMAEEPPYLKVGTDVSAKYKGAFCEAKITEVKKHVKLRVSFEGSSGTHLIDDTDLKPGSGLDIGTKIEAKHPETKQQTYVKATITKILDHSRYTVIFDDGDNCVLRRNSICLKSGKHFDESETLDQLPLTNPEHFGNPVKNTTGETGIKVDLITRGMKLMVKYGEGKMRNVYEAKVNKIETNQAGKTRYFVHYTGWNNRYDEWITKNRILKILTDQDNLANRDSRSKRQQQQQDQQPDETQRQQNHDQESEHEDEQEPEPEKKPEKKPDKLEKSVEKKLEKQVEKKLEKQIERKQDKHPEKRQERPQEKKQEKQPDRRQDKQVDRKQDKQQQEKKTDNDAQLQQRSPARVTDDLTKKVEPEPRQCLENGKSHESKPECPKRPTAREPQHEKVVAKDDLVLGAKTKQVQPEEIKQNQDQKQREVKPQPQPKPQHEPQHEPQIEAQAQSQLQAPSQATHPAPQPKQNSRSKPKLQLQAQQSPTPPEPQSKSQPQDQLKPKSRIQQHQQSEPQRKPQTQPDPEQPPPQSKPVAQPDPKPIEEPKSIPKAQPEPQQEQKEEERDLEMQLDEAEEDEDEEEDRRADEDRYRRNQQILLLQQQEQQLPAASSPTRTMSTSSMDASTTTTTTPTTTAIHLSNGHIYNFCEDINESDCDRKISILQDRIMALRQKYVSLKTELNDLDRRRKRFKTDRFNSDHITQKHTQQF